MLKTTIIFDNTEFEKKNPFLFSKNNNNGILLNLFRL